MATLKRFLDVQVVSVTTAPPTGRVMSLSLHRTPSVYQQTMRVRKHQRCSEGIFDSESLHFRPRRSFKSKPAQRGSERERESVCDSDLPSPLLLHPAVQRDKEQWLHSALGFQSRQKPQVPESGCLEREGAGFVFAEVVESLKMIYHVP